MASEIETGAMRRAIALSLDALGTTNPNPSVGAVVLDATGVVVGEGVTQPIGGPHAEVGALLAAGSAARGGTIVVTLEPCRHVGRTPPCTEAILAAGVARVAFAVTDPHQVAGGGGDALRAAGVDVEAGLLAEDAAAVLGRWSTAVARRRPHVTWKYAASLDGLTAAADGTSQWITGPDARRDVHRERFLVDAVIVGIGTVLADDPSLTVRDWPAARQPLRVVVDSDARTPLSSRAVDGSAPSVVIAADDAPSETVTTLRANGVDVVQVPRRNGHVDPASVLATLGEREVLLALLEGGATLASAFLRDGLIDRVVAYQAPLLLGTGTPVLGDVGVPTLAAARQVEVDEVSRIGRDLRIVARVTAGRP